ncbi:hypothetical protein Q9Q99_11910 [Curtobacterium flaccumfaciens]|nr:hypothetical protein Q9Q99_11910 [Curtobacterium flaccumfaciens]
MSAEPSLGYARAPDPRRRQPSGTGAGSAEHRRTEGEHTVGLRIAPHAAPAAHRPECTGGHLVVHPGAGVRRTVATEPDGTTEVAAAVATGEQALQRERLAPQRFDVGAAQEHVPPGRDGVDGGADRLTDRLESLEADHGDRGVHVCPRGEVAVADDPEPGPQLDPVAPFVRVRRPGWQRAVGGAPLVPVPR